MITDLWLLALVLFAGHFLCDYSLQGLYFSEVKNPFKSTSDIPSHLILLGHASIHGAFVAIVTGWVVFGYIEVILHYLIDLCKCRGVISYKEDQYTHLFIKLLYLLGIILYNVLKP